ncbi:MAG: hypothetical protein ACHBN1_19675 [Heteroscytonema crispum UTEX LB 1556]
MPFTQRVRSRQSSGNPTFEREAIRGESSLRQTQALTHLFTFTRRALPERLVKEKRR